ncbi:Erg28 like protein-domain-containing protein [Melanogaster broomeanus]|nr:Erg28 like protein-domain-containing protein [Melanogaster broomeanus]
MLSLILHLILTILLALPKAEGFLPKWQLIVATMAVFNTFQNFATLKLTLTALQARTFAAWTLTSAVVRGYAATISTIKPVVVIYDMALFTYLIAFGHFTSELFIFRTAKINVPVLSPVVVSTVSLVWMFQQYEFYVRS